VARLIVQRLIGALLTLFAVSVVAFVLIQLPPGDFADAYANKKQQGGTFISQEEVQEIRRQLGLDRPLPEQYVDWVAGVLQGDLGFSWEYRRTVAEVIGERLPLTLILAFSTLIFTYVVAVPIGIWSAVRQYSPGDHLATILGYIGLATPNFLLALILMYLAYRFFGQSAGGLFSPEYQDAPWSWARVGDLLQHLWIPVIVLGTAGTAFQIRTVRAVLLDELNKMYVVAARAGGLSETRLLLKYPVRTAMNPVAATLGWELTNIISGAPIVGVVLSLPDTGPLFLQALLNQDMYLAGAMILIYCALVIVGTFVSDLLLMWLDPRVRQEARS
jgi:peptide/nickel transport system permease protein